MRLRRSAHSAVASYGSLVSMGVFLPPFCHTQAHPTLQPKKKRSVTTAHRPFQVNHDYVSSAFVDKGSQHSAKELNKHSRSPRCRNHARQKPFAALKNSAFAIMTTHVLAFNNVGAGTRRQPFVLPLHAGVIQSTDVKKKWSVPSLACPVH